jgi:hypothetical protein
MFKVTGTVRLIDPSLPSTNLMSHCTSLEVQITWNQKGQTGPVGPQGPKGDKGDPGTNGTSVSSTSLATGDANCANGGAKFTSATGDTYACNGNAGANGKDGTSDVYFNRNYSQSVALALYPGVTVAALSLPAGTYMVNAKFRYEQTGTTTEAASCAFDPPGSADASAQNAVAPGGGQSDGYMMTVLTKAPGDDPDVHIQCFGPSDVHIVNAELEAVMVGTLHLQP